MTRAPARHGKARHEAILAGVDHDPKKLQLFLDKIMQ
jgi:hypothetical protein